jgi:hypothetical protein
MRSLLGELAGALEDVGRRAEAAKRWEQVLRLAIEDGAPPPERAEIEARVRRLRSGG